VSKFLYSIRHRILLAFLLLAITGVISSVSNIVLLLEHKTRLVRLHTESLPALTAAYEISRQGESIINAASSLIRTRDKWTRDAFKNRITDQFLFVEQQLKIISKLGYGANTIDQIQLNKHNLEKSFKELVLALEKENPAPPKKTNIENQLLKHAYHADLMSFSVASLAKDVSSEIDGLILETQADIQRAVVLLFFYSIGAIIFAVLVVSYLDTNVSRRVVAVQRAMRAVADGDTSENIPHGGNDEISDMGLALEAFVRKIADREERLHELIEATNKANNDKSTFLAAASHDMRQPLQAMSLFFYALKNSELSHDNREIIKLLEQSAASLGQILNRLLDLSRLEAGVVKIDKQVFSIPVMFEHLLNEFSPVAIEKGLQLDSVPFSLNVFSDPVLLENILRNLMANAINNTKQGRILLGCRRAGPDYVKIQVLDTGVGIAEDKQSKIFDEFYQLDVKPSSAQKGLGLGLSIVQKIAKLLDLDLTLSSKVGHGTMFSITVPIDHKAKNRDRKQGISTKKQMPKNLSIIVIDDEEAVRNGLSMMLSASKNCVVATDAVDCQNADAMLELPLTRPDIIVADYRLANNKTGIEAISNLCEHYREDIPAILLTGDTGPDRLSEISSSGYALMHKPIKGDELLLQIHDVLNKK